MNLYSKKEITALEAAADRAGIPLSHMMEQAGLAIAQEIQRRWGPVTNQNIVLLCGKGNNGGDGFVCARILAGWGANCSLLLLQGPPASQLAQAAFRRLPPELPVIDWEKAPGSPLIDRAGILVDCVYGFGFQGRLPETIAALFRKANSLPCRRISADLPSGAQCDSAQADPDTFRAHVTVTFTGEKPAHRSFPAKEFCGETLVRSVGIPAALVDSQKTAAFVPQLALAARALRPLAPQANKGDQGRLLLVCGSYGMAGACVMAGKAALRTGAGLVQVACPKEIYPILASALPQAVFTVYDSGNPEETEEQLSQALKAADACVIGCGLGGLAALVCPIVFRRCACPLVIDADGLNFCAKTGYDLASIPAPLVLTPHPGEMARLTGKTIPEIQADRIRTAREFADARNVVLALKGAATLVAKPYGSPYGLLAVNSTGNPGMAKGGSGDVLAGMIGSLLAQGMEAFQAAWLGVFLHGLAGDLCGEKLSLRAMLPTDLIDALPQVFQTLEGLAPESFS